MDHAGRRLPRPLRRPRPLPARGPPPPGRLVVREVQIAHPDRALGVAPGDRHDDLDALQVLLLSLSPGLI